MKFLATKYGSVAPGQERPILAEYTLPDEWAGQEVGAPEPGDAWLTVRVEAAGYLVAAMHFRPSVTQESWELAQVVSG